MIVFFGTKVRHQKLGEGEFHCPKCQARRQYHHKRARQYFTLYFIPLIPLRQLGEYVECQTCKTAFEPAVLNRPAQAAAPSRPAVSQDLAALLNSAHTRLQKGYPVDYMVRDLTAAGLDLDIARQTVDNVIGPGRAHCDRCGLSYASGLGTCAVCGGALQ